MQSSQACANSNLELSQAAVRSKRHTHNSNRVQPSAESTGDPRTGWHDSSTPAVRPPPSSGNTVCDDEAPSVTFKGNMRRSSSSIKHSLLSSFKRRTTEEDLDNKTAAESAIRAVHDAEGTVQPFEAIVENALHNETAAGVQHHRRPPSRGPSLQNISSKAPSFKRATSFVKNPSLQRNVSK